MNPWHNIPKRIDYSRWLDAHPATSDPRYPKIKSRHKRWGEHLRRNYPKEFERGYRTWWVKQRPEVWAQAYEGGEQGEEKA